MGCNIPRPWKRPPTPPISDQPYGSRTNEAVKKTIQNDLFDAFIQFGQVAHDLTYHDTDLDQKIKERRTNCPNCCAVITGPICEYCGTRFPDLISDEVVRRQNRTQFRSGNPAADVVAPTLPIKKQR